MSRTSGISRQLSRPCVVHPGASGGHRPLSQTCCISSLGSGSDPLRGTTAAQRPQVTNESELRQSSMRQAPSILPPPRPSFGRRLEMGSCSSFPSSAEPNGSNRFMSKSLSSQPLRCNPLLCISPYSLSGNSGDSRAMPECPDVFAFLLWCRDGSTGQLAPADRWNGVSRVGGGGCLSLLSSRALRLFRRRRNM